MSIFVSQRCWNAPLKPTEKLTLMAMADFADDDGVCWPSYGRLAKMVGVERRSIKRVVLRLVEQGHIVRLDTCGRGNTNTYIVSFGLPEAEIERIKCKHPRVIEAQEDAKGDTDTPFIMRKGDRQTPISDSKEDYTVPFYKEEKGVEETQKGTHQALKGGLPVPQTIIEPSFKPQIKESTTSKDVVAPSNHQAILTALAKTCIIDLSSCTEKQRGQLAREAKLLRTKCQSTPEDIYQFHNWWWAHFWKGRDKREPPDPSQVRENWAKFIYWRDPPETISPPAPGWQTDLPDVGDDQPPSPDEALRSDLWEQLKTQTTKAVYDQLWAHTDLVAENGHYELIAPSAEVGARLERWGIKAITPLLAQALGRPVEVRVR